MIRGSLEHRKNRIRGQLTIRGCKQPILIDLLGSPDPDLQGKSIVFAPSDIPYYGGKQPDGSELEIDPRQFGTSGTMTAASMVRTFLCPIPEFLQRSKLGEPPPMEWKRRLYLEWFGPDGRVVVELPDPEIAYVEYRNGKTSYIDLESLSAPPFDPDHPPPVEESEMEVLSFGSAGENWLPDQLTKEDVEDKELSDPEVKAFFESNIPLPKPRKRLRPGDMDALKAHLESIDEWLENDNGMELGELIGKVPEWRSLNEQQAETWLKRIVIRLALHRIHYDICEHCDLREAYRILIEILAKEVKVEPDHSAGSWVTEISTWPHCEQCLEEI